MNDSRQLIFDRLKNKLGRTLVNESDGLTIIKEHIQTHPRGPIPVFSKSNIEQFILKVEKVSGTVESIKNIAELPTAISNYMHSIGVENKLVATSSTIIQETKWPSDFEIEYRYAISTDTTSLNMAYAGIAETGSLVLHSTAETPTTLNFLPDNFICVIEAEKIHACMEDIWDSFRKDNKDIPRTINIITGPSRTADVEQTIQLGAHGPRRLHIIILNNSL